MPSGTEGGAAGSSLDLPPQMPVPHGNPPGFGERLRAQADRFPRTVSAIYTAAVAAFVVWVVFTADGGINLTTSITAEIGMTIVGTLLCGAAALLGVGPRKLYGGFALIMFGALVAWIGASVAWSVQPEDSYVEYGRAISYVATFAAGIALVRLGKRRYVELLTGLLLACLAVVAYALLSKVLPADLAADEQLARLRIPFGYWNAVSLMAMFGVPLTLWLGSRRSAPVAARVLCFPALAMLLVAAELAFSRGGFLAVIIGCAVWFAFSSRRLRSLAVLAPTLLTTGLISIWIFSNAELITDRVALDLRVEAGAELAGALILLLIFTTALGFATDQLVRWYSLNRQDRKIVGTSVVVGCTFLVLLAMIAVSLQPGGIPQRVNNAVASFTDPSVSTPDNSPNRLLQSGSVRARYWDEAFRLWQENEWVGVGAEAYQTARLRIRTDELAVAHAHGYVPQTLADLGLIGLSLSLLTVVAWLASATGTLRRGRGLPISCEREHERDGLVALVALVVTFGIHSTIDWTWFVPGNAIVALLAAGWVAGRSPLRFEALKLSNRERKSEPDQPAEAPAPHGKFTSLLLSARVQRGLRITTALGLVITGLLGAYVIWQPKRSADAASSAIEALAAGDLKRANQLANDANEYDPLALFPITSQAAVLERMGDKQGAAKKLEQGVSQQPSNPRSWEALGLYQLEKLNQPAQALKTLQAVVFLDPKGNSTQIAYFAAIDKLTEQEQELRAKK